MATSRVEQLKKIRDGLVSAVEGIEDRELENEEDKLEAYTGAVNALEEAIDALESVAY